MTLLHILLSHPHTQQFQPCLKLMEDHLQKQKTIAALNSYLEEPSVVCVRAAHVE